MLHVIFYSPRLFHMNVLPARTKKKVDSYLCDTGHLESPGFVNLANGIKLSGKYALRVTSQGQKEEPQQQKQRQGSPAAGAGAGDGPSSMSDNPVSHWRSRLTLNVVSDHFVFDREYLPSDVHRYLTV